MLIEGHPVEYIIKGVNDPTVNGVRPSVRGGRPGERENLFIPSLPPEVEAEYKRVEAEKTRDTLPRRKDVVNIGAELSEISPEAPEKA